MARTPKLPSGQVTLAQLSLHARRLVGNIAADFFELGRVLSKISQDERFRESGYESFSEYVVAELELTYSTAYKFMDVYRNYSAGVARRYGVSKLEAGIAYMRATPADEQPGDIVAATLYIQDKSGKFVRKKFHDATVREIRAATAIKLAQNQSRKVPARISKRAVKLGEALPEVPSRLTRGDRIRMQRDRKTGEYFATFVAIPLSGLDEYIEFLKTFRDGMGV